MNTSGCPVTGGSSNMLDDVASPEQIAEVLSLMGYESSVLDGNAVVNLNVRGRKFPTIFHASKDGRELLITCHIASVADGGETAEQQANFLYNCLDMNDQLAPYATAIIKADDLEGDSVQEGDAPVIALVDRVPVGDFSTAELHYSMESLRRAILTAMDRLAAIVQQNKSR